jgi:hypothetical protein
MARTGRHDHHQIRVSGCAPDLAPAGTAVPPCRGRSGRALKRLLIKKRGRNLRAGQADQWTEEWMHGLGLHKLSGAICYPKAA